MRTGLGVKFYSVEEFCVWEDHDSSFATVYAAAGVVNQKYVLGVLGFLGMDCVFNYKELQVVDAIASAARENGLIIQHCFVTMGQLASCQAMFKAFFGMINEERTRRSTSGQCWLFLQMWRRWMG